MTVSIDEHTKADKGGPLSAILKEATAQAHETAENSGFMERLLSGQIPVEGVSQFTGQLWFIYDALERTVSSLAGTSILESIADERLERRGALEADLQHLIGEQWRDELRILPATAAYVARLEELNEKGQEHRVLAHHYVRYLGDISGGQVIAARLNVQYDIDPQGLNFYDFSELGKIPPYRAAYRDNLDKIQLTDGQRQELVEEARQAFAFNTEVFRELGSKF